MYMPASRKPGPNAAAYKCGTEMPSTGAITTSITEGGIRMPSVPPAVIAPADMRTS
jgi:hypothetical protein